MVWRQLPFGNAGFDVDEFRGDRWRLRGRVQCSCNKVNLPPAPDQLDLGIGWLLRTNVWAAVARREAVRRTMDRSIPTEFESRPVLLHPTRPICVRTLARAG